MKYVLPIGLVAGTETTCNSCALLDKYKRECRVPRWNVEKQFSYMQPIIYCNKLKWNRPEDCPLEQVERWPNERD
jgi:hypothetical protein